MARLTRRKCARNLIVVKVVVKDSADRVKAAKGVVLISVVPAKVAKADAVKVGPVLAVVKTHAVEAKTGLVLATVKTHADPAKVGLVLATVKTHVDPAKAIEISLALNAMMPKVC